MPEAAVTVVLSEASDYVVAYGSHNPYTAGRVVIQKFSRLFRKLVKMLSVLILLNRRILIVFFQKPCILNGFFINRGFAQICFFF
jgi:hypothetical protein